MKAFVLEERNKAVLKEVEAPKLDSDYAAILSPIAVSVCSSDVNTVYGTGSKKPDNLILGHEAVARIVELGAKVKDFSVGDVVAVPAMTPNWRDVSIQDGNLLHAGVPFSSNALGRSIPGVFAEYFMIEDADMNLAKIDEDVSPEDALMCVDMVTTGFTGVESADISFGDSVLVIGIGPIGLMAIQGASLKGASDIMAIGTREASIELAKKYGACEILSYKDGEPKLKEYILDKTKGLGVDVVIICGGSDESFAFAIDVVKYGIGRVVNLKHYAGEEPLHIPKFSAGRGMSGKSIYMELGAGGRRRLERLLSMVKHKRISPGDLITHRFYGLEHIGEALELMRTKPKELIKSALYIEDKGV